MMPASQLITNALVKIRQQMDKTDWAVCPSCGGEWTKLAPCPYWWFDQIKFDDIAWLCVECAETLKGFEWIIQTWPIKKPHENWRDDWVKIDHFWPDGAVKFDEVDAFDVNPTTGEIVLYREKMFRWGNLRVRARAWPGGRDESKPAADFTLTSGTHGAHLVAIHGDERVPFDNVVALWFYVKQKLTEIANKPPLLPELARPRRL